jgi:hypothetical protein
MEILKVGSKAYYDSFSGMIACIVTKIDGQSITARITSKKYFKPKYEGTLQEHKPYKYGEEITSLSRIIPRKCVKFSRYGTCKIYNNFKIEGYDL